MRNGTYRPPGGGAGGSAASPIRASTCTGVVTCVGSE